MSSFTKIQLTELTERPTYREEVAPLFAKFLLYAWQESAENFAADLAGFGATPQPLRMMAGRWRECDFEPLDFADALEAFADAIERGDLG